MSQKQKKTRKDWSEHIALLQSTKERLENLKFEFHCSSYDELLNKLLDEIETLKGGGK